MVLTKNIVHQNMNKIPYYNPNYAWDYSPIAGSIACSSYTACQNLEIENCPWQCRYGKASQDYIIDGMGVYVTRNNNSYLYGQMELSENICYENGINGGKCDGGVATDVACNVTMLTFFLYNQLAFTGRTVVRLRRT